MILGRIRHQALSIRQRYIVADTIDYLTARFEFETEEWIGLTVWAHFKKDGVIYDIMLDEDGEILENKHLCLTAGYWQVYLHGDAVENGETVQRITTDIAVISVAATGFLRGQPFPEMPASAAEQILARALEAERLARSAHHPWATLERLRTYLYRVSFHDIPEYAPGEFAPAGCSSYVNGGKLYRNLDWKYSQAVSFVVVCKGFMGMAFDDRITEGNLDDDLIGQLPYRLVDGINENGIMMSTHVLFNDWNWRGSGDVPLQKMGHLILTKVKSMESIADDLNDVIDDLCAGEDMGEYLLQFLITDGTTTYCLMPPTEEDGTYVLQNITNRPKLTNFRWVNHATVSRGGSYMQQRPTGVERWNIMSDNMERLRFTAAYEDDARLSEFIGIDETTKDSTDAALTAIYERAHAAYIRRERDGLLWQTMHSVVYSAAGMEHLYVQENWKRDFARA